MTDLLDHLDLRHLPPLEPIELPPRLSQTLIKNYERCQRSGYLYVKHHGGLPGVPLDRGSAMHLAIAECLKTMLAQNEPRIPPDVAKTILEEVLDQHPEWTIPLGELDALRQLLYHWSMGFTINPESVVAVERKFVLDLEGRTLSGILDYAEINGQVALIRDWKSTFALPDEAEAKASFQGKFYSVLLMFGNPVNDDGSLDPCLGDRLTWVDVREAFPRYLRDGEIPTRPTEGGLTRLEVEEARRDIARKVRQFAQSATTGEWPAMHGSHCSECAAESECPLPRTLRNFAGAINTLDEAQEAAMWVEKWQPRITATRKELKLWAKQHGPFRFGRDREMAFVAQTATTTDWEQLERAIEDARSYGVPFNADDHRKRRMSTRFISRTVGRDSEDEEAQE